MIAISNILKEAYGESRMMANIRSNKPVSLSRLTSLARNMSKSSSKILNPKESEQRVSRQIKQGQKLLPRKNKITVGPGKLPIKRHLPSYPK